MELDRNKLRLAIELCRITAALHFDKFELPPLSPIGPFSSDSPIVRKLFEVSHFLQVAQVLEAELHGDNKTNDRFAAHFAEAVKEFGNIPEGKEIPQNAITLWKAMIHGWDRVADRLTSPTRR